MNYRNVKLKDLKYIDNLDLSKETPRMKNMLIAWVVFVVLWPSLIMVIIKYAPNIDMISNQIVVIITGLPFVIWGAVRTWKHLINPK